MRESARWLSGKYGMWPPPSLSATLSRSLDHDYRTAANIPTTAGKLLLTKPGVQDIRASRDAAAAAKPLCTDALLCPTWNFESSHPLTSSDSCGQDSLLQKSLLHPPPFPQKLSKEALQLPRLHTGRRHRFKALASSFASFSARFMAEPTSNPHPDNWTLPMSGLGHGPFCPRFPLPFPQLTEPRLSERDKEAWTLRVLS